MGELAVDVAVDLGDVEGVVEPPGQLTLPTHLTQMVAPPALFNVGHTAMVTQIRRRSVAQRANWWRFDNCSLRSTDETWVSTVLPEMYSSLATSL